MEYPIKKLRKLPTALRFQTTLSSPHLLVALREGRLSSSGRHFVEKRRIVIAGARLVDEPGYRSHAKAILGGGPQNLYSDLPFSHGRMLALSSTTGIRS